MKTLNSKVLSQFARTVITDRRKIFEQFENLTVRNAAVEDADLLSAWWNDGKIMAHAGFLNGTGETSQCIAERVSKDEDNKAAKLTNKGFGGYFSFSLHFDCIFYSTSL